MQINDNKSGSTDATQLANIKAYAERLKDLGTDITKGYEIPILYNGGSKGFIGYNPNAKGYYNGYAVTNEGSLYTLTMNASTGALTHKILANTDITDSLSANKQPKTDDSLATKSKTITGAINELAARPSGSSGAGAYVEFSDITKLNTNLGARLLYTGKDVTLSSPITINENIYEIDFNGKSINLNLTTASGTAIAITGHARCLIRNLGINGTWNIGSENTTAYILNTFGGIETVNISCSFNCTKANATFYPWGIHNANHLVNVKVAMSDSTASKSYVKDGACYSYCTYMTMCRAAEGTYNTTEQYESNATPNFSFFHCRYMDQCIADTPMNTCSDYTNMNYGINNLTEITTGKVTYDGYDLTHAVSTIAAKNNDSYSKALVHPAGGTGVAEIPIVHDAVKGNSIVRRKDDGTIIAADGVLRNECMTIGQFQDSHVYIDYKSDVETAINTIMSEGKLGRICYLRYSYNSTSQTIGAPYIILGSSFDSNNYLAPICVGVSVTDGIPYCTAVIGDTLIILTGYDVGGSESIRWTWDSKKIIAGDTLTASEVRTIWENA